MAELEDVLGVALDAVFFLDDLVGVEAGLVRFLWVVEPGFQGVGKSFRGVGLIGGPALGLFDDFGEGSVVGLYNGDAGGEGFDGVEAEGFWVAGGDGEDGELLKVGDFFLATEVLAKGVVVVEFGEVEFVNLFVDKFLVVGKGGAGDMELGFGGDAVIGL